MADPQVHISTGETGANDSVGDIEMGGDEGVESVEVEETAAASNGGDVAELSQEESNPPRTTFIDYLKSPIVELLIGTGDHQTLLTAHQALLTRSPFFVNAITKFSESATSRRIPLPMESLDAVGCFLQYLYTGEYFPRKLDDARDTAGLEQDPDMPSIDDTGDQLLKHARVYTLADKLGLPDLKTLSHSKIHRISSTASGEIAYARYVYAHTPSTDTTIRKPVASFWGQRSHVLRHEAEKEFKDMCLEFPEFGFDVLSFVLDAKERRGTERESRAEEPKSARKRARNAV
ncbi:MAG: hypothetical protein LQ347_000795 [Umbilicaria vellea]|nr:MAG: hypothetical protein LQ347_000795 [Umbilicaria vellea]